MQSAAHADDLHSILGRFSSWAGKQPGSGPPAKEEGVREIPYEEALQLLRNRRAAQGYTNFAAVAAERSEQSAGGPAAERPKPAPVVASTGSGTQESAPPHKMKVTAADECGEPQRAVPVKETVRRRGNRRAPAASPGAAVKKISSAAPATTADFRQVLEKSLRSGKELQGKPRESAERNLRITVRFSRAEEQEIHQRAAQLGLTVSSYLRNCALEDGAVGIPRDSEAHPICPPQSEPPAGRTEAAAQTESNWLARLRQRFLAGREEIDA